MKILGIDPGLATMGWSIIETHASGRHQVQLGVLETPAHLPLTKRLALLKSDLQEIFDLHKPAVMALETLFLVKNARNLAMVAHARGVILMLAGEYGVEVFEYAPRQIKLALTGYGAAEKKQMQSALQRMLGLTTFPKPDDAADAAAVGLCHLQYSQQMGKSAVTV